MAKRPESRIPHYKRRKKRNPVAVLAGWIVKIVLAFLILSALWVLAYRFINPPITATMLGDIFAGRGATRDWMPIEEIDRDMVRAAIAAEDSKFCQHSGFDLQAIEEAAKRNASGGRIRGGSTISQQTVKNAFLWQGGGYVRKGLEAWFTLLTETMWDKRRIMEVYLNLAETGIGTYGVNAGSLRYFGHDASALSRTEAARIAAVLPLPKERGAIAPKGFTRRYGNTISSRTGVVARDGLDACVYSDIAPPKEKAPPRVTTQPRPMPGEEYEATNALPPVEQPIEDPSLQPADGPALNDSAMPNTLSSEPAPAPAQQAPDQPPPAPGNGM